MPHTARVVLRPTASAKRWGGALDKPLDQEQFLDLVDDGITEIASPDGAVLHGLISDLHAIRTTEVKSVIRTGGEGSIELAENAQLRTGTGTKVAFPEQITLALEPFVGLREVVTLPLRVKPHVAGQRVTFTLSCAVVDDALGTVVDADVAAGVIAWADAECFSYLKPRYPSLSPSVMTPDTVDPWLRYASATLAAHRLFGRRNKSLEEKRNSIIQHLVEIRERRNSLGDHDAQDLVRSVTIDDKRFFREKGVLKDYGEPFPGQDTGTDNDSFLSPPEDC